MSARLEPADEALLARLVTGELRRDSAELRERVLASPALARAVEELDELDGALGRVRDEDERLIAAASDDATDDDARLVAELLRAHRRRPVRRSVVGLTAAAAAVLATGLFVVLGRDDGEESAQSAPLGSDSCVRPRGEVDGDFAPFVVRTELPERWWMEIVVFDDSGGELLRSGRLRATSWSPSAAELARLDGVRRIRWQYDVFDADGEPRESGACGAARSR